MQQETKQRETLNAMVSLKDQELCTSGEAFHVISEERALRALEESAHRNIPNAPRLSIAHVKAFCDSIHKIAWITLREELSSESINHPNLPDLLEQFQVARFCPPPYRYDARYDKLIPKLNGIVRFDYPGAYDQYLTHLLSKRTPQEALASVTELVDNSAWFSVANFSWLTLKELVDEAISRTGGVRSVRSDFISKEELEWLLSTRTDPEALRKVVQKELLEMSPARFGKLCDQIDADGEKARNSLSRLIDVVIDSYAIPSENSFQKQRLERLFNELDVSPDLLGVHESRNWLISRLTDPEGINLGGGEDANTEVLLTGAIEELEREVFLQELELICRGEFEVLAHLLPRCQWLLANVLKNDMAWIVRRLSDAT